MLLFYVIKRPQTALVCDAQHFISANVAQHFICAFTAQHFIFAVYLAIFAYFANSSLFISKDYWSDDFFSDADLLDNFEFLKNCP